jgi:hypothetical protein
MSMVVIGLCLISFVMVTRNASGYLLEETFDEYVCSVIFCTDQQHACGLMKMKSN